MIKHIAAKQRRQTRRQERIPVLGELCSDGVCNVFSADPRVDFRFVTRPHVTTPELGAKIDGIVELMVPKKFGDIYWPCNLIAMGIIEKVTPADLIQAEADRIAMECIKEMGRSLRDETNAG